MEESKRSRIVFRNASPVRSFYLRSRDPNDPKKDFILGPGMTVEALDEVEEIQLASMSYDLVDVAKETPALANTLDALRKELEAEKAKNAQLLAEKAATEKQTTKVGATTSAKKK